MPEIRPFPGVRYRVSEADLGAVLAPPYDVIPHDYARSLLARHPRNVVRLILNLSSGAPGYDEAGATYRAWLAEGVLAADAEPALYLLEQAFVVEGQSHVRLGMLARFRAEEPERGTILPHEQTRQAAKEDRYRMLLATRANFSPIFLMFPDSAGRFVACAAKVMQAQPIAAYTDDGGVKHRLWRIADEPSIAELASLLGSTRTYIADGHHRHATALRHRDATGPDGAWTLGYFTPIDAPGLVVLPYHRVVSAGPSLGEARGRLAEHFDLKAVAGIQELARAVSASRASYAFGLATPSGEGLLVEARSSAAGLAPADAVLCLRALDTFFLHRAVLGPLLGIGDETLEYVHSLAEARDALATGRSALAILMRATRVRQIVDVADARESMPAKSTFFHPKLPSGLVIHPLLA